MRKYRLRICLECGKADKVKSDNSAERCMKCVYKNNGGHIKHGHHRRGKISPTYQSILGGIMNIESVGNNSVKITDGLETWYIIADLQHEQDSEHGGGWCVSGVGLRVIKKED